MERPRLGGGRRRWPELVAEGGSTAGLGYRPPASVRTGVTLPVEPAPRVALELASACDGRGTFEERKRATVARLRDVDERTARDLAHVIAVDLVVRGALRAG